VDPDGAVLAYIHSERVEAASFISGESSGKTVEITDESILDTGLV
jgi:hypothetical protein